MRRGARGPGAFAGHRPRGDIGAGRYIVSVAATMIVGVAKNPTKQAACKALKAPAASTASAATRTHAARRKRSRPFKPAPTRARSIGLLFAIVCWGVAVASSVASGEPAGARGTAGASYRLVSLNPSLTAIVLRLGAGEVLVGVDDYSARLLPEMADLPRVGGLFDPGLESIVSLRPDRVLLVDGIEQQAHAARLEKLGLEVEVYRNERLDEVLENIDRLGRLLGRETAARARIRAILEMREAVALITKPRRPPRTVAIVDRSPLYLVGAGTFLDEMLSSVGATNIGRLLAEGYPRASIEWLISSSPELLLDLTPGATAAADFWSRWPSIPAVAAGRVVDVDPTHISIPGPDLDRALLELAVAVHGAAIEAEIIRTLAERRAEGRFDGPTSPPSSRSTALESVEPAHFAPGPEESTTPKP